jgi:hypothetical protein
LTDFAHAGQVPQWGDFVCLEAMIRFDLSQAPDLLAWQEFEECLITPTKLYDRLRVQDVIADLRTGVVLIERIRRQASSEAGDEILPYYAGLLVWAVEALSRYDPATISKRAERMRGAHLLLAAAMLARKLGEVLPTASPRGALRLDDEGVVWIGDHHISTLMGQELALLRCMYERKGKIVSRQTIVESAFGERYVVGDSQQEGRINALLRRLRIKIEPDPNRPCYILTARGKGYRLLVGDKADG